MSETTRIRGNHLQHIRGQEVLRWQWALADGDRSCVWNRFQSIWGVWWFCRRCMKHRSCLGSLRWYSRFWSLPSVDGFKSCELEIGKQRSRQWEISGRRGCATVWSDAVVKLYCMFPETLVFQESGWPGSTFACARHLDEWRGPRRYRLTNSLGLAASQHCFDFMEK